MGLALFGLTMLTHSIFLPANMLHWMHASNVVLYCLVHAGGLILAGLSRANRCSMLGTCHATGPNVSANLTWNIKQCLFCYCILMLGSEHALACLVSHHPDIVR